MVNVPELRLGRRAHDLADKILTHNSGTRLKPSPNKITGANSRPASQFERHGLRQRALVVESPEIPFICPVAAPQPFAAI